MARSKQRKQAGPKVISLYTGAGGLDLGLEAAGFITAVASEFDADCCATLRENRAWPVIHRDIHQVPSEELLDIMATLIRCSFCDAEWGRVNGFWVESKPPRCMECGGDGKTVEAEPKTCPSCAGTGREGGVKGGIEPSSPLPLADVPPSPHGSVFGTDAVCMPPVYAGGMTCPDCDGRGYGVTNVNKCSFCGGTGHALRDHK